MQIFDILIILIYSAASMKTFFNNTLKQRNKINSKNIYIYIITEKYQKNTGGNKLFFK